MRRGGGSNRYLFKKLSDTKMTASGYILILRNLEEMCNKAARMDPSSLEFVPGHLKMQKMCDEAVRTRPYSLKFLPDHLKTKDMCDEAVGRYTYTLGYVPNNLKMQGMCERAIEEEPRELKDVQGC